MKFDNEDLNALSERQLLAALDEMETEYFRGLTNHDQNALLALWKPKGGTKCL